ncbi:hypothetical protein BJ878DRAFT_267457 [Calycina marina]|uniref:Secreted protein n=1 Tax=Calycina marina TaxID=1763456 RepID=A0A9P7Z6W4_9HELO|nr:hypothetical protein BJ878DRAFT_267457 [Calycina marina]
MYNMYSLATLAAGALLLRLATASQQTGGCIRCSSGMERRSGQHDRIIRSGASGSCWVYNHSYLDPRFSSGGA